MRRRGRGGLRGMFEGCEGYTRVHAREGLWEVRKGVSLSMYSVYWLLDRRGL